MNKDYNYRFIDFIKRNKNETDITLFFDIETYSYNKKQAIKESKPTLYKNATYSVAVSYFDENELKVALFSNFYKLFENIKRGFYNFGLRKVTGKANIILIAHNNNKYDNHFLLKDLCYFYPEVERRNMYMKNGLDNAYSYKLKEIPKDKKESGIILEKRVKSSINLDMEIFLNGIHYKLIDNFVKTNMSIKTLGNKLKRLGLITEDELKTSFDYEKFDLDEDMTDKQSHVYGDYIFTQLNDKELTYIKNDVIILAKSVKYYEDLFPNFDYNNLTFTKNILDSYNTNPISSFQLLNNYDDNKRKLKYTDYVFADENFYDYLKSFYRGGLNFYNPKYINKIILDYCFSMDLNSSYPHSMEGFKIPTFLCDFKDFKETATDIYIDTKDKHFFLYRMTKNDFNDFLLSRIDSTIFKKMLVKYYTTNDFVNINTYTVKLIEEICHVKIDKIRVLSFLKFECIDFGSVDQLRKYYFQKSQGKIKNKLVMDTPREYKILNEINEDVLTSEEIDNVKVKLNGLYGLPALKAYFNLFRLLPDEKNIVNIKNGYKNNERNLLFSTFVTAVSFYNLLTPLKYLTQKEIDDNFIYCDTDSLYLKSKIRNKIPKEIFDPISLGAWDIENDKISEFYVLNHKKYCYYSKDKKVKNGVEKEKGIVIKCGGIPLDSFDTNYKTLSDFVEHEFHEGKEVKNTKSIYTQAGTIAIYPSSTKLDKGKDYASFFTDYREQQKKELFELIKEENPEGITEDYLFIESNIGTFTDADINPKQNTKVNKKNLNSLLSLHHFIKKDLESFY